MDEGSRPLLPVAIPQQQAASHLKQCHRHLQESDDEVLHPSLPSTQTLVLSLAVAGSLALLQLSGGASAATQVDGLNAVSSCDYLAAGPNDPDRKSTGIELKDIVWEEAIAACLGALASEPTSPRFAYQLGRSYQSAGQAREALRWYGEAATREYAIAKHDLAMLTLRIGESKADHEGAARWMESAARQGLPIAQATLGSLFLKGTRYLEPKQKEGRKWLRTAVENGWLEAQFDLATAYDYGLGGDVKSERAASLYEAAARRGYRLAEARLARLHILGAGVPANPELGWSILNRLVNQTGGEAEYIMANLYLTGTQVEEDQDRGYEFLLAAAEAGSALAVKELIQLYLVQFFMLESADFELPGQHTKDEAIHWIEKVAERGNLLAAIVLRNIYGRGQGVPVDKEKAAKWDGIVRKQSDGS